jgi:cold shock CspA family protein
MVLEKSSYLSNFKCVYLKLYNENLVKDILRIHFIIMSTESPTTNDMVYEGRVKWFNNKAGYGFITVIGSDKDGVDIFAHHSTIQVSEEQYRYLVQGEYLEFKLSTVESDSHKYQAIDIRGVKGGKLLCETRNESRAAAPPRRNRGDTSKPRANGSGPRDNSSKEEWVLSTQKSTPLDKSI